MDTGNKLTWGKTKEIEENWPFLNRLLQYPQRTPEIDGQELELDVANRNEVQECGTQALSSIIGIRSQADEVEGVQHITREPTYLEDNAEINVTSDGTDRRESDHEIFENGVHTPTDIDEDELGSCESETDLSTLITELEILNSNQVDQLNVYRARMAQLQDQLQVSNSGRIGEVDAQEHKVADLNRPRIKPVISPMSFSVKKASTDAIEVASRWRRDEELAKLHAAPLQTTDDDDDDEHTGKTRLIDEEMRKWAITSINLTNELSTTKQKLFQIRLRRHMKAREEHVAAELDIVQNEDVNLFEYHSLEDSSEEIDQELEGNTLESNEMEPPKPDEQELRSNTNPTQDESDCTDVDLAFSNQSPMLSSTDITHWSTEDKYRVIMLTETETTVADSGSRGEEDNGQNIVTNESRFTESTAISDATEILTDSLLDFHDTTKTAPQQSPSCEVCDTEATFDQLKVKRGKDDVNERSDDDASKIHFVEDVINISVDMSNQSDRELNESRECYVPDISQLSKPNVYKCPDKTLDDKILTSGPATLPGDEDGSWQAYGEFADGEFDDITAATYYHSHSHEATSHHMCFRCSLTSKLPCAQIFYENDTQEVVEDCFDDKDKFVQELTNDLNEQLKSMMVYNGLLISTNSRTVDWEPVTGLPVFLSEHDLARNTRTMKEDKDFESEIKLHKFNYINEGDSVTINLEEDENADKDESDALGLEQVSTGRVLEEFVDLSNLNTNSEISKGYEVVQELESVNKESLSQIAENNSTVNLGEKEAVESTRICGSNTNITHSDVAAEQFETDKLQNTPECISVSIDQEPQAPLKAIESYTSMLSDDSENVEYISAEEDIEEDCVTHAEKPHVYIDREESQQQNLLKLGTMMLKQIENQSLDLLTDLKSKVHQLEEELAQVQHYLDERDPKYQVSTSSQMCRSSTSTLLLSVIASEPPSQYFNSGNDISSSIPQPSNKPSSPGLQPQSITPSTVLQPQSATTSRVLQPQSETPSPVLQPQSITPSPVLQPQSATTSTVVQPQSATASTALQLQSATSSIVLQPQSVAPYPVLQPQSATPSTVLQHQSATASTVLQPQSATSSIALQPQSAAPYPVLQPQSATPSTVLQSGYNALHPETISHFGINIIGRVTTDSILIGWELPYYDGAIKSFRIYIDQEPKLSIHSGSRSTAVIHQVNLSAFFAISVHAIGLHGLCIAIGSTDYAPYPVRRNNL